MSRFKVLTKMEHGLLKVRFRTWATEVGKRPLYKEVRRSTRNGHDKPLKALRIGPLIGLFEAPRGKGSKVSRKPHEALRG